MTVVLPASPAAAINRTDRGTRTDFVKVWYDGGAATKCFANAGTMTPGLPDVENLNAPLYALRIH